MLKYSSHAAARQMEKVQLQFGDEVQEELSKTMRINYRSRVTIYSLHLVQKIPENVFVLLTDSIRNNYSQDIRKIY